MIDKIELQHFLNKFRKHSTLHYTHQDGLISCIFLYKHNIIISKYCSIYIQIF